MALLSDEGNGLGESCGNDKQSDHLIMVNAYKKWEKVLHQVRYLVLCPSYVKSRVNSAHSTSTSKDSDEVKIDNNFSFSFWL